MVQEVSRLSVTAEDLVPSLASLYGICGGI